MLEGFDFGTPSIGSHLTGKLAGLKAYNALPVPAEYFDEAMARLRDKYLNVALDAVLHPASGAAKTRRHGPASRGDRRAGGRRERAERPGMVRTRGQSS